MALNVAKKYFREPGTLVFLVDYLLRHPCYTYLHLLHGLKNGSLKFFILTPNNNAEELGKIAVYSFPNKYMTHEYICENFSKIVLWKEHIDSFQKTIQKYSVLTEDAAPTFAFCTIANIRALAPQLAYVIQQFINVSADEEYSANDIEQALYGKENWLYSRFSALPRDKWRLSYAALWPEGAPTSEGSFTYEFIKDTVAVALRDALIRGGVTAPKRLAPIIDKVPSVCLTDHDMGELVRPSGAKKIKFDSMRGYGRGVRGKTKKK